jgi:hypothetical protein
MDRMSFIFGIILLVTAGWVITTWIRARHGYPITDDWGRTVMPKDDRAAQLLASENEQLKAMICRLEERLSVLERIATDQPDRLSAEIERLR